MGIIRGENDGMVERCRRMLAHSYARVRNLVAALRAMARSIGRWSGKTWGALLFLSLLLAMLATGESWLINRFGGPIWSAAVDAVPAIFSRASGNGSVAVVIVTDQVDPEIADAWPLPFSAYSRFLYRAWCFGARAVYVDIGFERDRNTPSGAADSELTDLAKTITTLTAAQPAQQNGLWQRYCPFEHALQARSAGPFSVFVAQPFANSFRRTLSPFEVDPTLTNNVLPVSDADRHLAALEIADALCDKSPLFRACRDIDTEHDLQVQDTFATPLLQRRLDTTTGIHRADCVFLQSPRASRIGNYLRLFVPGRAPNWFACPPVLTIDWSTFFGNTNMPIVAAALRGKVLVLGASLTGMTDLTSTTLGRALPGVYVHALAVSQLLDPTARMIRPAPWWGRFAAIMAATFLIVVIDEARRRAAHGSAPWLARRSVAFAVGILGISAVWTLYHGVDWPPQAAWQDGFLVAVSGSIDEFDLPARLQLSIDGIRKWARYTAAQAARHPSHLRSRRRSGPADRVPKEPT